MALRLTPTGDSGEAAAALLKAQAAQDAAEAAMERANNARGMVLADRERNALSLDELRAAAAQLPVTQQAAAEVHLALQQQLDMLREMVNADATENDATQSQVDALVQQVATIELTPGPQGERGPEGPQGEVGPRGTAGAAGATGLQGLRGETGQQGPKGDTGAAGTSADNARVTALEQAVTTLNALKVRVAFGSAPIAGAILGGATRDIVVTLDKNMGSAAYSVGYSLSGGTGLLGNVSIVGIVGQTATTVTVQIKNGALASVANAAATVYVVAAREA